MWTGLGGALRRSDFQVARGKPVDGHGQRRGLGSAGTPGPKPRTDRRRDHVAAGAGLGRLLRPARWPPARPFPTRQEKEGLGARSDEGWGWCWALPAEPARLPSAPLAAGAAVFSGTPRDGLPGNRRCHARLFPPGRPGRPGAPGCGMWPLPGAPPTQDRAFLKELTQGQANSCRPGLPGPAPGMRSVAAPGPREEGHQRPVFQTWRRNVLSRHSRHPRPRSAAAAFLVRAGPARELFPRSRASRSGFYGNLTFCYFLFSFLWFLQL